MIYTLYCPLIGFGSLSIIYNANVYNEAYWNGCYNIAIL